MSAKLWQAKSELLEASEASSCGGRSTRWSTLEARLTAWVMFCFMCRESATPPEHLLCLPEPFYTPWPWGEDAPPPALQPIPFAGWPVQSTAPRSSRRGSFGSPVVMIAIRAPSVLPSYALVQQQQPKGLFLGKVTEHGFWKPAPHSPSTPWGAKSLQAQLSLLYHPEWKQGKGSFRHPHILGLPLLCCRDFPAIA